ncbi:MAG TPA: hypothetical protein PLR20_05725 [Syntrophales bacterium]|jgi:hypothetical protein|nr:hypothetical protein [Syntrophales bacterium]HOX94502.1 hypothetical protein [Syntrophales bacterium]HPI57871.1 hypothetical protein [Syntrophales bacterium]HPN24529.1 hypothetical protein [Syntrophales bacterium]HQM28835.1 hypothetical protein [Syntrophales bacterium]
MTKVVLGWLIVGVLVVYYKIRQSQAHGFDRKIDLRNLHFVLLGIIFWPLILFYIYREGKSHREALKQARMNKSDLDGVLDELEKELDRLDKAEKNNKI